MYQTDLQRRYIMAMLDQTGVADNDTDAPMEEQLDRLDPYTFAPVNHIARYNTSKRSQS